MTVYVLQLTYFGNFKGWSIAGLYLDEDDALRKRKEIETSYPGVECRITEWKNVK